MIGGPNKSINEYVEVNFIFGNFYFSFVSTSLPHIIIPKNKRKMKITWDKKLTTTDTYVAQYPAT